MKSEDNRFERELEVFRNEVEAGTQFLFAYLAVNAAAHEKDEVRELLNTAPLFWRTCLGALQTAAFIALGRVFERKGRHNIYTFLRTGQENLQVFSKEALARRKQGSNSTKPEWLDEFVSKAYVPTAADFDLLLTHVDRYQCIYKDNYKDVRDKWFAHKVVSGDVETARLWGKGSNRELQRMFAFLTSLHKAMWELFFNGRKPVLQQGRYSLRKMRKIPSTAFGSGLVQEHITREVEQFLAVVSKSKRSEQRDI